MNCNKVSHLLSAYMDGELLGHEHRLIHHHLQRCQDCRTEYDELLQMKRLLAAMRVREPGRRLAAAIVQRVSEERAGARTITIGDWTFSLPSVRARAVAVSPILGFSLGVAVFGLLVWARPASPSAGQAVGRNTLEFEAADVAREEPAPHVGELTNGLMREAGTRQAAYEAAFPDNLPDFPLAARRSSRPHRAYDASGLFR